MKKIIAYFIHFLFPQHCLSCRKPDTPFCTQCISKIKKCTISSSSAQTHTSLFSYKDTSIKKAIWRLKYKNDTQIAIVLGNILYDSLLEDISDKMLLSEIISPVLIPIPITKNRRKTRGYNQTERLCKAIIKQDTEKLFLYQANTLLKTKDTKVQSKITNKKERIKNIKNCFSINNPGKIKGKDIILIDDILTTGATLNEAKKVILKNGARSVWTYTLAH